jgi:VWFA-related protein
MRRRPILTSTTSTAIRPSDPAAAPRTSDLPLLWMVIAAGLAIALAAVVRGQTGAPAMAQPQYGERIDVDEVLIDALVTDRQGNVILGLRPEDFRVRAGGRPAEITGLTFYSNRRYLDQVGAERLGIDPAAVPDRRYFILFFDDQRSNALEVSGLLQRQLRAALDAQEWVRASLQPGDLVAVVSYFAKLRVHTDFTADRSRLAAAIEAAARSDEGLADWPSRRPAPGELPALTAGLPAGKELRDATPRIYDALERVATAAAPIPGRKNLVLFSIGFGDVDGFGLYRRDARFHRKTLDALNAANVATYAVDLTPVGSQHPFRDGLNDFAVETGGRLYYDDPSFDRPLRDLTRETNGYYLIAFRAPREGERGELREIEVELANPEFKVTARRGYRTG